MEPFAAPLRITRWERSVWGWTGRSLAAQLRRGDDRPDAPPRHQVDEAAAGHPITSPTELARLVAVAIGFDMREVRTALSISNPPPQVAAVLAQEQKAEHPAPTARVPQRTDAELTAYLAWLPGSGLEAMGRDYYAGVQATVEWAAGRRSEAPATLARSQARPDPEQIRAEQYNAHDAMQLGAAQYRQLHSLPADVELYTRAYFTGVENAAAWVIGAEAVPIPDDWPWPQQLDH